MRTVRKTLALKKNKKTTFKYDRGEEGGERPFWKKSIIKLHFFYEKLPNFPRLKNVTFAPRHLGRSSQRQNWGKTAAKHPIVFTNGLEI